MTRKIRTDAGSPIVEGRVSVLASGGAAEGRTRSAVVHANGKSYTVPIDENGRVPESALVSRFLNTSVGPRPNDGVRRLGADAKKASGKVHQVPEGGFTPEEIVATGWWDDPGKSDIEGIDDGSYGALMDFGPGNAKVERAFGGKVAIIAPTEAEKRHIADVLDENFTASELKAAAWKYGLVIKVSKPKAGCSGHYMCRQELVPTPEIVLCPNANDETIVHEFQHHLRYVDPSRSGLTKTPVTILPNGREMPIYFQQNYDEKCTLEEAANVAEVTGRTRGLEETNTGYYWMIPKPPNGWHDGQGNFEYDRDLLTGGVGKSSRPKKGKRLMDAVEENFDDTRISKMKYKGRKSALGYVRDLREAEKLPPRRKPAVKPARPAKPRTASAKPKTPKDEWLEAFLNGQDPGPYPGGRR